jgi:ABC-type uncharacterized transport system auxiliary subunit
MNPLRKYCGLNCTVSLLLLLLGCTANSAAQETVGLSAIAALDTTGGETKHFPAQVSFFYPYGTHGRQSAEYGYNFSLNIITGKVGKVNGMEISGLVGRVQGDVTGIQLAGLINATGCLWGIQISGLINAADDTRGIQATGLFNAADDVAGIQISGLINASDDARGIQASGLINAADNVQGIQFAGLGNASDDVAGVQISGLVNAADNTRGIQAGLFNAADDVVGMQIAGIGNAADNVTGIQVGGLGSAADVMTGLQIGVFNRTITALRGFQAGIVSINDTIERGGSLSIVNIVKRGAYREWELSAADYANIALSFKMGTQRLYTIYTVGASFIDDMLWTAGIGFGHRRPVGKRWDFQPEIVSYNSFPKNFKHIQSTTAIRLKFGFVYRISDKLGLSLAPGIYVMNAQRGNSGYYRVSPVDALYTHESGNRRITAGVGVSAGLSFR